MGRGGRNARKRPKTGQLLNWNPHYISELKSLSRHRPSSSTRPFLFVVAGICLIPRPNRATICRTGGTAPYPVTRNQRLNESITVKYTVSRIVSLAEPKTPFGEKSILLMVEGPAPAGVRPYLPYC